MRNLGVVNGDFSIPRSQDITNDRIKYSEPVKCGTTSIVAGNIIVGTEGTYKHLKLGTAFDVTYPILYANSAISALGTGNDNYVIIPMKITTTQSITFATHKPVYIKGTLNGTTFTPISTAPITQTIPTSADGYQYILLGYAYDAMSLYLSAEHPIYTYKNNVFGQISSSSVSADKLTTTLGVSGGGTGYTSITDTNYTTMRYRGSVLVNDVATAESLLVNGSVAWIYK